MTITTGNHYDYSAFAKVLGHVSLNGITDLQRNSLVDIHSAMVKNESVTKVDSMARDILFSRFMNETTTYLINVCERISRSNPNVKKACGIVINRAVGVTPRYRTDLDYAVAATACVALVVANPNAKVDFTSTRARLGRLSNPLVAIEKALNTLI